MSITLLLSIIFASTFAAFYKVAAQRGCNLSAVNLWLYVGSTSAVAVYALSGKLGFNIHAILLGAAGGTALFLATVTFFEHIRHGQLSASWTVISLSVGFPVAASIAFWHEHPTPKQIAGFAFMAAALLLFGRHEAVKKTEER